MRPSLAINCIRSAIVVLPLAVACGSSTPTGNGTEFGNTTGSGNSGNGNSGSDSTGSSSGAAGSGNGSTGSGNSSTGSGNGSTGNGSTGSGNGSTGSSNGSTGSSNGSTGSSNGSTGSSNGSTGSSTAGASGTTSGGTSGGTPSACGTPAASVLSDFEQGTGSLIPQGTRNGFWYVFADANGGTQTPASVANGPIAVASTASPAPMGDKNLTGETCNKYALHSQASGHTCSSKPGACYSGFGASFIPGPNQAKGVYSLSAYDGIQFDIATPSSSEGTVYFEVLTKESQPGTAYAASHPGTIATGTATNDSVDAYNNRGFVLSATGSTPTGTGVSVPTAWTTVYVPFSVLVPFYFPQGSACGTTTCQAPEFTAADALGFQISQHDDFSTNGSYDLWIDNVALYTGDNGLVPSNPTATPPAFNDGAKGWSSSCTKPTFMSGSKTAAGKYLLWAYRNWKNSFVKANGSAQMVISPEVNGGSVVSEGIAYGMLISAYMGDQTLFDGLWSYWSSHSSGSLMTWRYDISGNSSTGSGSASDADQDAAWALYVASKVFATNASTYATNSATLINAIWSKDFDPTTSLPSFGSNSKNNSNPTNPSYFAPAYYPVFGLTNTGFNNAAKAAYSALNAIGGKLPPAWCSGGSCTQAGSGGLNYANETDYQYDAHRVPWRVGLDYCWSTPTASMAASYLGSHVVPFFSGLIATSGGVGGGIDALYDEYTTSGQVCTGCTPPAAPNSMSLIGSAAVGAMATGSGNSALVNAGWQFVLDGLNRGKPNVDSTKNAYFTYYNTTVGLLTALSLSGNFYKL